MKNLAKIEIRKNRLITYTLRLVSVLLITFSFWYSHSGSTEKNPDSKPLILSLGSVTMLDAPGGASVHFTDSSLLKIKDRGTQIALFSKKKGEGLLIVGNRTYNVVIAEHSNILAFRELKKIISNMKGLSVQMKSDAINVFGQLLRYSDWQQIQEWKVQNSHAPFNFNAQVHPQIRERFLNHLVQTFRQKEWPWLGIDWQSPVSVKIPPKNSEDKNAPTEPTEEDISLMGLASFAATGDIVPRPMIELNVLMAEIDKGQQQLLGVKWPTEYKAQVLPTVSTPEALQMQIQALEAQGKGQILASPKILCRSGSDAQFHAGGEIPLKVYGYKSAGIEWKKHGIILNFSPLADRAHRLSLKIETSISMLDTSTALDGIPGLKTNRMSSHIDMHQARTVALSGLIREDWMQSSSGLPFLSRIPVLGRLFSSQNYLKKKSELVVFVTPQVITENSWKDSIELPDGWESSHDF